MKTSLPPGAAWYPQYLPYPHAIPMSRGPVPNATAVNFPQGQFAPEFLPPGSPSFQPYNWNKKYKVLYTGGGNPYMTKTPRTAYGTMAQSNPGCGCGAKTNPASEEQKAAWKAFAVGLLSGLALYHTYIDAKNRDIDAEDREAMR